ncbi:MAG: deoxyuridine 5'-triphosphate nucleotidohydrolase [Candidatus Omnitrophota bacterium]|jgi:dUTP pyrophosphatase
MLNREELEKLITGKKLIEGYIDLDVQLTPNGFDLTVGSVFEFDTAGALDFSNKERKVPGGKEILAKKQSPQDKFGWWHLAKGAYKIKTNETVNLPNDLFALAFSRTSLLRMGAFTQHGVWDAGFHGRGEFILAVENPHGITLKQNARIAQLVFIGMTETSFGYRGVYQEKA